MNAVAPINDKLGKVIRWLDRESEQLAPIAGAELDMLVLGAVCRERFCAARLQQD